MRSFTVSPIGLVTSTNKLGVFPEGAMSLCQNLRMRGPGKLVPLQVVTPGPGGLPLTAGSTVVNITPCGNSKVFMAVSTPGQPNVTNMYLCDTVSNGTQNLTTADGQFSSRARCRPIVFRNRLYVMTTNGLMVLDVLDGTDTTFRPAQLPQGVVWVTDAIPADGSSIDLNTVVGYTSIFRRKYSDGYELIGPPSPIQSRRRDIGFSAQTLVLVYPSVALGNQGTLAGDVCEIYRTRQASSPSLGLATNPGTTVYACGKNLLTAANNREDVPDVTPPNQIGGDELYTNPGQETLQSIRFPPPAAKAMAEYKGTMFYANITNPGVWVAAIPGSYGNLEDVGISRKNGIGNRRLLTGTWTNGSITVASVATADMIGIKVGQKISNFTRYGANQATITNVASNSFQTNIPAISSGGPPSDMYTSDALEIDGSSISLNQAGYVLSYIGALSSGYRMIAAEPMLYNEGGPDASPNNRTPNQQFAVGKYRLYYGSGTITVRGSNGQNYNPPIPTMQQTAQSFAPTTTKNALQWSWDQQPESVSPAAYAFVGLGEIYQLASTRDAMWIFASDGLWRLTGYGTRPSGLAANYRIDLIDKTISLAGPNAFAVLRDAVYAYTNIGLVKISDAGGIETLSRGVVSDILPGRYWVESGDICMTADEINDEIYINIVTGNYESGTGNVDTYVWSDVYKVFTEINLLNSASVFLQQLAFDRFQGKILYVPANTLTALSPYIHTEQGDYVTWSLQYQPHYGPDPASSKQWIDMIVMADPASAGKVVQVGFNNYLLNEGGVNGTLVQLTSSSPESRCNYGVGINAPAVANSIAPYLSMGSSSTPIEIRGISLRYEPIDEQVVFR